MTFVVLGPSPQHKGRTAEEKDKEDQQSGEVKSEAEGKGEADKAAFRQGGKRNSTTVASTNRLRNCESYWFNNGNKLYFDISCGLGLGLFVFVSHTLRNLPQMSSFTHSPIISEDIMSILHLRDIYYSPTSWNSRLTDIRQAP